MSQVMTGLDVASRTLYISGDIDAAMAHRVVVLLSILDSTPGPIRIILNSQGGVEEDGYAIYDAITMCKNEVTIDGYGAVQSIAAAIFQAGDVRRLAPHASFMIHDGTAPSEEGMKQVDVIDLGEHLKRHNSRYHEILVNGSRQELEVIVEWCKHDTYFLAQEALEYGFADEIIPPLKTRKPPRRKKKKS